MPNALDYLEWRGDLSLNVSPFNEVDMFLCSMLSSPDYTEIMKPSDEPVKIGNLAEKYFLTHSKKKQENIGVLQSDYLLPAFQKMGETERFRNIKIWKPVKKVITENTEQFCAITICFPSGSRLISIRGTDDSIIGWKENFQIAFKPYVAAQTDALNYLMEVATACPDSDLYLCGHSKGGNLAIYAASKAPKEVQRRIKNVISYDGPGFREDFLKDSGYNNIKNRIYTILSQNSMVGTLLNRVGKVEFVKSCEFGPMAHDGFSWEVLGKEFVPASGLSETSINFENAMRETLAEMDDQEMEAFTEALFNALLSSGAKTINEVSQLTTRQKVGILNTLRGEKKVRAFIKSVFSMMIKGFRSEIISKI